MKKRQRTRPTKQAGSPWFSSNLLLTNAQVVEKIHEEMKKRKLTPAQYAAQLMVCPEYLNEILLGHRRVPAHIAERLGYEFVSGYRELRV